LALANPHPRKPRAARRIGPRAIQQFAGALDQIRRETPRDEPPLRRASEPQAHDADVEPRRPFRKLPVLERPVVPFDGVAESLADGERPLLSGQPWNEKTEGLVRRPRHEIVGAHLLLQQPGNAPNDAVGGGVAVRLVAGNRDGGEADRTPPAALLDGEELLELLDESRKVDEPGFGVRFFVGEPPLETGDLVDETRAQRLDRLFEIGAIQMVAEPLLELARLMRPHDEASVAAASGTITSPGSVYGRSTVFNE